MRNLCWAGLTALALSAGGALADSPATIIVMDGSGSMWGQIGGRTKLEIARETVTDVLGRIPPGQHLGLMAYGHRERGNCADIELMVPPAPGTAAQIGAAVQSMRFQGKTPLSESVRQAAEALRFHEEAATVVLVTDGLETCSADPCALGRELEAAGLNFTAHVIGFGLSRAESAEVACLAETTGGRYLDARDAGSLAEALTATVTPTAAPLPPPAPIPKRIYYPGAPMMNAVGLQPTGGTTGAAEVALPTFDFPRDGTIAQCQAVCQSDAQCAAWRYEPTGSHFVDHARCFTYGASTEMDYTHFGLDEGWASGIKEGVLVLLRPYVPNEPLPEASLQAPGSAQIGQTVAIGWSGPADDLDSIEIGLPDEGDRWAYAYASSGNPISLTMPGEAGTYELRYRYRDQVTIARRPILVTETAVTLTAPDRAPAGTEIAIHWTGPDADYDNIQIAEPGSDSYISYGYVRDANPLLLTLPEHPGRYELRYKLADTTVIATRMIEALAPGAAPPADVAVPVELSVAGDGADLAVSWSAVPVEGQDLPPEAWAPPSAMTGPVTAEFLPGRYDVRGEAGDHVFAGMIEVVAGGANRFVIPASAAHSPAGEDHGAATPGAPVALRISGVYPGAFASWTAAPLDGQASLPLASGELRPNQPWQTRLDPGAWLIQGRHAGAKGATYLAVIEVTPGMAPDLTVLRPRYGADAAPAGSPLQLICGGDLPCFVHHRNTGLQLGLPPGWGMEEPVVLETAGGAGPAVFTILRPAALGDRLIGLNPRQWDAMLGPCEEIRIGRLCRSNLTDPADRRAFAMLGATAEYGVYEEPAATPPGGDAATRFSGERVTAPDGINLLDLLAPHLRNPEPRP